MIHTATAEIVDISSIRITDSSCGNVAFPDIALMAETEEGNTGTRRANN